MININTKPDTDGFWYLLHAFDGMWFQFEYFAICSGGHIYYGNEAGFYAQTGEWVFVKTKLPVIHIGIKSISFAVTKEELEQKVERINIKSFPEKHSSKYPFSSALLNFTDDTMDIDALDNKNKEEDELFSNYPYYPYYPYYPPPYP